MYQLVTLAWHTKKQEFHGSNRHLNSYDDPNGGFVGGVFASQAFELWDIVERADPRVPPTRVKTQQELIDGMINQEVTFARLCTAFALLALAIACIGLYGTMSYGVSRRTSEIGVRMALGARSGTLVWMVLRDVFALAAIGLAVSLPAALAASKLVESFLFQMKPNDPLALAAAVLTMAAATLLAGYLPARHASRINPMVALRHE
jgi:macrolide transport system ATP-binding/permease protein